jgi:murein DD-endopeptidase MepM/ murein hydrolase activator NlpD
MYPQQIFSDLKTFTRELSSYLISTLSLQFFRFEAGKAIFVGSLYRQRGKMAKRLVHYGMGGLAAMGIVIAPHVAREFPGRSVDPWNVEAAASVLSASTQDPNTNTEIANDIRANIEEYTVQDGDTVSSIADKFGISADTVRWQNSITGDKIKVGDTLEILPVTGIAHKVQKGDTLNSIAKRYDVDPQEIVNWQFNTFVNDETFELAVGQIVIVPNGVKPADNFLAGPVTPRAKQLTPNAGTVSASGNLIWPTAGVITQNFAWYHPGIDIANPAMPSVLAADSGTIIWASWDNTGYGNKIMIDHGNGVKTLYGHLSQFNVVVGQTVKRGDVIGRMGSTGRSTGPHLHFEVHMPGGRINPLSMLR